MAERLGRYQLVKHLTSGGMAEVLLGRSDGIEGFERHVVLKRIRAEHARDERFISMFLDEARLAAGLHHQHIVQVFDIGETDGEFFFAMEYIHGEDLRKLLSAVAKTKQHVPLGFVCAIVSAAASGLHYAHERKDNRGKALHIVHRDVSPSNILIGYDGSVKVLDFGIAKAAARQAETVVGGLKGKTSYMSPEQCRGMKVDRRSDVYGLGVLLYELATTTRLFKGDNEYLVMDAIVNGKFALPQVRRPDLPNELSQIIMTALAIEPDRRFQSADELRMALDQFVANYDLATSTSSLSSYMRKIFGERPEPWLEGRPSQREMDLEVSVQRGSWSDLGSVVEEPRVPTKTRTRPSLVNVVAATGSSTKISPYDTGPSMKFGWEARAQEQLSARNNKLLWVGVPALALVAFGLWKFGLDKDDAPRAPEAATAAAPAPAPMPTPAVQPPPPPVQVAAAPAVAPVAAVAQPAPVEVVEPPKKVAQKQEPQREPAAPPKQVKKATHEKTETPAKAEKTEKTEKVTASSAATAQPAPAPTPQPAPAAPAPAPAPAPAAPAPQAITAAPAPVAPAPARVIEATIPTLSNATVAAAASDHAKQLSKCEGTASLRGDVSVTFQIDGTGKVVKSQLSSTIKNPKVAGCILKSVQSWKFPRPMAGAAKGLYTISYQ